MNQEQNSDQMQPHYDIRGGVRGKYLARYRAWAGVTEATGTVEVQRITSAGRGHTSIVREAQPLHDVSAPILGRMNRGSHIAIAPEDATATANAV